MDGMGFVKEPTTRPNPVLGCGFDDLTWVIMDGLTEYIHIHRYVGSLQDLAAGKKEYITMLEFFQSGLCF